MNNNSNAVAAKSVPPRLAFEGITVTDDSRHSSSSVSSWTENHSVIEIFTEEETPEKKTKRSNKLQQVPIRSKRNAQRPSWAMQSPILQKKPKITGKNAVAGGPARGKKRRQRPELDASAIVPGDGRPCDFCHKTQGVCALMHCAACRRAYHAKCFVGHFRPHCKTHATAESEDVVPIEQQIAALQLNPPDNVRVTIFRCGPCHAAFIEFFNSGGYEWDCECPSCKEPDKLIAYRRQMLLKIMLNEDDPKKKSKASDESEAMVVDSAEEIAVATVQLAEAQERRSKALRRDEHTAKANEDGDGDGAGDDDAEPEQENDMIDKAGDSAETPADVEPKPELSEDEQLLAAVTIKFDSGRDCFDIVCVVDTSTGESIKKTGLYFVKQRELPPRRAEREDVNEEEEREPKGESVYCYCCSKDLTLAQFVRHSTTPTPSISAGFFTANPLLPEAAAAIADPRACLFVCHHDGIGLTPLVKFLNVLQKRQRTATTAVGGSPAKNKMQRKPSLSDTLAEARQTLTEAVISRRYMATKSPRNVAQMYAIKLVCLSKKLMVQMPDKVMQSTMDPSMQLDYPYKEGWLSFDAGIAPRNADSKPPTMSTVQCSCCKQDMALDAFIVHTKLEDWSPKFKRRFVHVPQVGNERKLVELEKIWQAVITLYQHRRLDQVLQQKVQAIER
uniref:Uncharacterized protein n=1 Tax=Globisporangium ultimum (strain ATCC 200006 / CBS 805.95 / DAOM BR144) TaxID=431595 RepID=K3W6H5_GLOUD